ncbi:MAG: NUMOD3 domain-containing DNA-binding protein [Candidatus Omnitrophica bacterium]|jgi:hypothetical protein|nr:NUMOD3 domain-containing DNA-binding protein [Candidatus Omnitrophota bacterium]
MGVRNPQEEQYDYIIDLNSVSTTNPYYVYHLIDSRDYTVKYVGVGTKNRMYYHIKAALRNDTLKNPKKYMWIRKMLSQDIPIIHKKVAIDLSRTEAFEIEKQHINYFGFKQLTNLHLGGAGGSLPGITNPRFGKKLSEETKQKIRLANLGRKHAAKDREKMSEIAKNRFLNQHGTFFGKKHTPETLEKMSACRKNWYINHNNGMLGVTHSAKARKEISSKLKVYFQTHPQKSHPVSVETRLKISNANKGRVFSKEAKINMSAGQIGRKHSEETKLKMSITKKEYWKNRKGLINV